MYTGYYMSGLVAPFVPTPPPVLRWLRSQLRRLLGVRSKQAIVYDAGCGDGLVARIMAETTSAYTLCVELDPIRIFDSKNLMRRVGLDHIVDVVQADVLSFRLRRVDLTYSYLLPDPMKSLYENLPGDCYLISLDFQVPDEMPVIVKDLGVHTIYVYYKKRIYDGKELKDNEALSVASHLS